MKEWPHFDGNGDLPIGITQPLWPKPSGISASVIFSAESWRNGWLE